MRRIRRRGGRLRLEHKVALLSALPILVLGLVLGNRLERTYERRLVEAARDATSPATQAMVDFFTTPEDYVSGYSPDRAAFVRDVLANYVDNGVITNLRSYRADGMVVWSPDFDEIGDRHVLSPQARKAAATGEIQGYITTGESLVHPVAGVGPGKTIVVINAIRFPGDDQVTGVSEIYIPYEVLKQTMDRDAKRIYVLLGVGLLALWALLWPITRGASRVLRRQVEENEHLAMHDLLTGLPNRAMFSLQLDQGLARARRVEGRMVGVLLLDLDRFKEVNDALGHHEGDRLLVEVAKRLRAAVRAGDTVARFGGDEFAIVLNELESEEQAIASAERIHRVLDAPVELSGLHVQAGASCGISLYPSHGNDSIGLVQRADVAMYMAKDNRVDWAVYDASVDPNSPGRLALVGQLRDAIRTGQLVVHYQPVTDMRTGETISMEALVRWQHPVRGLIPPDDFIPIAEGSGLIRPLTKYVLREALTQCRAWVDGGADVSVAVNLSTRSVQDPRCPQDVLEIVDEVGLPADRLIIEITESAILQDPITAISVLNVLRARGVRVALDDFGTGYSSLTQLNELPVDEIKIDRSFVSMVGVDRTTTAIVQTIVDLGSRLDLHVVAEGVEDEVALDRLVSLGCELAQGYYFSRPLPALEAGKWLDAQARQTRAPASST